MTRHRLRTPIFDLLGCDAPILLAGMGRVARSELVAAVALAGGYGILGMVRETPELISQEIDAVRARTDRPFAVNLIPAATDPAPAHDNRRSGGDGGLCRAKRCPD